jgi:hypothetical protein
VLAWEINRLVTVDQLVGWVWPTLAAGEQANKDACDRQLRQDLQTNCAYAYPTAAARRSTCDATSDVYYAAVVKFGHYPGS